MFQDNATAIPKSRKFQDLTGKRFGRLLALECVSRKTSDARWNCICDCGKSKVIIGRSMIRGLTVSCGCFHKERVTTHGKKKTPEWAAWQRMRQRCYSKNFPGYEKYYGGRGIRVCDRWLNGENGMGPFECFFADMGLRPSAKHSLDRIKTEGNYDPTNCQWSTAKQQMRNRRNTKTVVFNGRTISLGELAEINNLNYDTLYSRIVGNGWSIDRALKQGNRKCY